VSAETSAFLQGMLDPMILKTPHVLGPQSGFGVAWRIEQMSEPLLRVNGGNGLHLSSSASALRPGSTPRGYFGDQPAKFYSITNRGAKQLAAETAN
jgi:hypothetical protein